MNKYKAKTSKPVKSMMMQSISIVFDSNEPDEHMAFGRQVEIVEFNKELEKLMKKYRIWSVNTMLVPKT